MELENYYGFAFFGLSILTVKLLHGLSKSRDKKSPLPSACSVSAPGKALIAGGYLVLEHPNVGVVVSSTARFFATVDSLKNKQAGSLPPGTIGIYVDSPQFHSHFLFLYNYRENILTNNKSESNEFIEKCLVLVLSFAKGFLGDEAYYKRLETIERKQCKLGIKLRADNDFYSQISELNRRGLPLLSSSLKKLPRFLPCSLDEQGKAIVSKTGMGSSAALTTALVGALLQWFEVTRLGLRAGMEDRKIVHNLAQLAHAAAQGKIGSGFDVAAAVYGTILYKRFSADSEALSACMEPNPKPATVVNAVLRSPMWSQTTIPFSLPVGLDIVMGDVCGGSSSTVMAKNVLNWHKEGSEEAVRTWNLLAEVNIEIYDSFEELTRLSKTFPNDYRSIISKASEVVCSEWNSVFASGCCGIELDIIELLLRLRDLFARARVSLRTMGEQSGVGIEPSGQTALVDATLRVPGVLCAGVPGAGGVDAIFALILSPKCRENVEMKWSTWARHQSVDLDGDHESDVFIRTVVCPLTLSAEGGLSAGVRSEFELKWQ